jgi:hypothetical protein
MARILLKLTFYSLFVRARLVFPPLSHKSPFHFFLFYYFKTLHILILFPSVLVGLPNGLCPSGFPTQNQQERLAHIIIRQRIILMFGEMYKSRAPTSSSVHQLLIISYILGLSAQFSNTLSICFP